jgi:hypothetical protein
MQQAVYIIIPEWNGYSSLFDQVRKKDGEPGNEPLTSFPDVTCLYSAKNEFSESPALLHDQKNTSKKKRPH